MGRGNDSDKGKGKKVPKDDEKPRRIKHDWTNEDVELLIRLLVEEAQIQIGRGGSLIGFQHRWGNITERFNKAREGMDHVDRAALKNKGDTLKGGWRKWKDLTHKQTGLGWNEAGNCCTYPPEWVARKAQENRSMYKLINSKWPAHLVDDMELIWGQSYATGELRVTPGGTAPVQFEIVDSDEGLFDETTVADKNHNAAFGVPYTGCNSGTSSIFDLTAAAEIGANLTASAFQGSEFAGLVAGSSNGFITWIGNESGTPGDEVPVAEKTEKESAQPLEIDLSTDKENKPPQWDNLMRTTAGAVVHGGKRKHAPCPQQPGEVKKKSKGSRGHSAHIEELKNLQTDIDATLARCNEMLVGLDVMDFGQHSIVISVQEAASVIRAIPGLSSDEVTHAMVMIGSRSHRAVLMTLIDEVEIANWVRYLYNNRSTDHYKP